MWFDIQRDAESFPPSFSWWQCHYKAIIIIHITTIFIICTYNKIHIILMMVIITIYPFMSLVSIYKYELVYLWNPHLLCLKGPCFFDIHKDIFYFPNYHSILFGELDSLNRCHPSVVGEKGKAPASHLSVSCPKYELLHLNYVTVFTEAWMTHGGTTSSVFLCLQYYGTQ